MQPPSAETRINYDLETFRCRHPALLLSVQEPFSFGGEAAAHSRNSYSSTQVALVISHPALMVMGKVAATWFCCSGTPLITSSSGQLSYRHGRSLLLSFGLERRACDHYLGDHQPPTLFHCSDGIAPWRSADPGFTPILVQVPRQRVSGAMTIALWSQVGEVNRPVLSKLAESAMHGTWLFAIPVRSARRWEERWSANGSPNTTSPLPSRRISLSQLFVLIPTAGCILYWRSELNFGQVIPVILMVAGTIVAASVGRVLYQIALSVTGNDNGFVTMFFLPIPALTALISIPLSWWISDLHFAVGLDVLCRLICRLRVAPVFLAEILGTAGSAMITMGCPLWLAMFRFSRSPTDRQGLARQFLRCRDASKEMKCQSGKPHKAP